jgi:uncharacterized oligopeptide transporter (OPT) family protein
MRRVALAAGASLLLEALLVALFLAFPSGPCSQLAPGLTVLFLHYPALFVAGAVFGMPEPLALLGGVVINWFVMTAVVWLYFRHRDSRRVARSTW